MYYFPTNPPYFLLIVGVIIGITSGTAFEAVLRENAKEWMSKSVDRTIVGLDSIRFRLPFLGIAMGIEIFLNAGLEIFGFPSWLAYSISLPMTLFIAILVWYQLEVVFKQIALGGSKALDLDSWE